MTASQKRIGIAVQGRDAADVLAGIRRAEEMEIPAVWLTAGGANRDSLSVLVAAAVQTQRIMLGTSIVPIWPRHPIALSQQAHVLAQLAPGRFRLGLGPGHGARVESAYGIDFQAPLGHLKEYVQVLKAILEKGAVEFEGRYYHADWRTDAPVEVPVMVSALRRRSFELAGAEADGAISWVCPGVYLRDVAIPAMEAGARGAGRPTPPLVAHAPVCVHDDPHEVQAAAREQLGGYPRQPFYAQMFQQAGFPEAAEGAWSDAMLDAVLLSGDEARVEERLRELLAFGATEIVVSPVLAGDDQDASLRRTLELVASVARSMTV